MPWQRSASLSRLRVTKLLAAASAALLATTVLAVAPASAQNGTEPVLVVDPNANISFSGSGWGHGVGMSQWGAYSRALAGQTSADILAFYYQGTTLAENYGRPITAPTPAPTPSPEPGPAPDPPLVSIPVPVSLESTVAVHLATTASTTLTPQGRNRITIDGQNIPYNGQNEARAPANTPITFTHTNNAWHITINGTNICGNGCPGNTAQLLFATDTAVNVSNTGRSYAHGRFNLIATPNQTNQFAIILDSLTANKYLNDHNLEGTNINPPPPPVSLESEVAVHLATTASTTLTPQGRNRITIDGQNIPYNGQNEARAPANTPITFTHTNNAWHITINGTNICGNGCPGNTAQLLFATDTAVNVSNTGRSYAHGRFNLIATPNQTNQFAIILDSLTANKYLNDHNFESTTTDEGTIVNPPQSPAQPEDSIRVHLAKTTRTTLTPEGGNRITVDGVNVPYGGQSEARAPAGAPVTFSRHEGHWHIVFNGIDICGNGCTGHTAQLLFTENTSVRVSSSGHSYLHGRVNLVPVPNTDEQFYVVLDSLSMEEYLRGIAEVPGDWPAAALEAQVIAARTYAIAGVERRRSDPTWHHPFDLYSSVWDQVYVGNTAELNPGKAPWLRAVENTAGRILLHNGAKVQAYYSSSNGGHTERSSYVFTSDLAYLPAKPDPYDQQHSPHASWTRVYPVSTFNRWLNDHADTRVGQVISIAVVGNQGASGRLDKAQLQVTGTDRTITISGTRLQSRIYTAASDDGLGLASQLLSTKFTFTVPPALIPRDLAGNLPPVDGTPTPDPLSYTGVIDSPDFCLTLSLGGPVAYAFDTDGDEVPDVCSLRSTRRVAAARQHALDDMEDHYQIAFDGYLAEECRSVAETFGEPDKEAADICQQFRALDSDNSAGSTAPGPSLVTPPAEHPDHFYSGSINGPGFCASMSLGGPVTYPSDTDGDGVADVCALPGSRRAAVAHQRALERLATAFPQQYQLIFATHCRTGPRTLGEPDKEAVDECQPYRPDTPA